MRQITILGLLLLFAISCRHPEQKQVNNSNIFTINGIVKNTPPNTYVKLLFRGTDNIKTIDSAIIIDDSFELHGTNNGVDFYVLEFTNNPYYIYLLIDSADHISLKANFDSLAMYQVQNSNESKLIQSLENKLFKTNTKLLKNPDKEKEIKSEQKKFSKNFIKKNKYSLACIIALSEKFIDGKPVLPIEENYDLFKQEEKNLSKKYFHTEYYKEFQKFIKNYEIIKSRNRKIGINKKPENFINFKAKTIDGKYFKLSDYKGKNILLVFNASWCVLCSRNNSLIKEIEEKRKDIKIVQIFLDLSKNILNDTIQKYNFKHTIIQDSTMWDSKIVNLYGVDKLPTYILISPKGKIIFYSSVPEQLRKKLIRVINK